jgi:hypothetical protein
MDEQAPDDPRPKAWPYRADPPQRYWGNYRHYIHRGGLVRLEDDISGFVAGEAKTGDVARFYFFCVAFDQMMKENIKGDLAELGVYRGNTATLIATMARRMGTTAYLFDTFEGFSAADLKGVDAGHAMEFADTSLEAVRALVGEASVRYVKGYFPDSRSQIPDDLKFALVHIDCDLYTPISNALNYFYPRLVPGGYLIIHDYFSLAWDGAERAVDEFFADKAEPVIPLTDGGGSAVIRKARTPGRDGNWMTHKKRALLSDAWTSAAKGGLRPLLGDGWSVDEAWGVWGVGASHTLNLYLDAAPVGDVEIECEAGAALIGPRQSQSVDVVLDGTIIATWEFAANRNYGVRSVLLPAGAVTPAAPGCPTLRLEFRPHDVRSIADIDPGNKDTRALGMALKAIRKAAG